MRTHYTKHKHSIHTRQQATLRHPPHSQSHTHHTSFSRLFCFDNCFNFCCVLSTFSLPQSGFNLTISSFIPPKKHTNALISHRRRIFPNHVINTLYSKIHKQKTNTHRQKYLIHFLMFHKAATIAVKFRTTAQLAFKFSILALLRQIVAPSRI